MSARDGEGGLLARPPAVGDIAIVPYPSVRAQIGCGPEAGILTEDRRGVVKVFFPSMDRTFWLDADKVGVVAQGRLPAHPLVTLLHTAAVRVKAELIEIGDDEDPEEAGSVCVHAARIDLDDLLALRAELGDQLARVRVDPGGVRRTKIRLWLSPEAAPGPSV